MNHKIRYGMVGGGPGAMIGKIHRIAARMDNHYELVSGAFSRDHQKSLQLNAKLGLMPDRIYPSYQVMLQQEKLLPASERIEVVNIVTPNDSHFAIAAKALECGFHVIVDKPMVITTEEAQKLKNLVAKLKKSICITYTYSGYPMIKEMRHFIKSSKLGMIRKVIVNFSQGWLSTYFKGDDSIWRMDKKFGGGTLMDIGTHAFHLAEYVTGLRATHICADVTTLVQNRELDDDSTILLKFDNGARGVLMISQIAAGDDVDISVRVYGEQGSLHWSHDYSNNLLVKWLDQPAQIFRHGYDNAYLNDASRYHCRTTSGHPEGYLEAFANIYRNFALCLNAAKINLPIDPEWDDYPKIDEGIRSIEFVEQAMISTKHKKKWVSLTSSRPDTVHI